MNKRTSLVIGIFLLIIAICFIEYAVNHHEIRFLWSNRVTFVFYGIYIWLIFKFLLDNPVLKMARKKSSKGSLLVAVSFFCVAFFSFILVLTEGTVNIFTILRGFLIICGIDVGIENISLWIKTSNKNTDK